MTKSGSELSEVKSMIRLSDWLIDLAENNYVDLDEFGEIVILPIKESEDG